VPTPADQARAFHLTNGNTGEYIDFDALPPNEGGLISAYRDKWLEG
jgi:hypothetical protein